MQDTNDSNTSRANSSWTVCLERTRSAVLNVLVGVGLTIAVGGWLLRRRAAAGAPPKPEHLHHVLLLALVVLAVASYLVRRMAKRRVAGADATRRQAVFYWSHVLAAAIAALAAPLGIVYGWWIDPRLEAVIPFWIVPLALGFLAIPRVHEVDDYERMSSDPGEPRS